MNVEISLSDRAVAAEVAAVSRASFADADPVPGLPIADGAREGPAAVAADLAAGARLWVARESGGALCGSVRAFCRAPDEWVVRRLAVTPAHRGTGLARQLMRRLEADARADGAARVTLDAVVERGNPPFYTGLGYRTLRHFGARDKPLSEVAMWLDLAEKPLRLDYPWPGEHAPPPVGTLVSWHAGDRGTVAVVSPAAPDPRPLIEAYTRLFGLFLGADGGSTTEPAVIARNLADDDGGVTGRRCTYLVTYARAAADIRAFAMPRTMHDDLLALWRLPRNVTHR